MGGSGGGGGGFFGGSRRPEELRAEVLKAIEETGRQQLQVGVAALIGNLLAAYNSRDYEAVAKRLAEIEAAASDEIDGAEELLFGGSVAKHTYVDGLSDIDSLLIIDRETIEGLEPRTVLRELATAIRGGVSGREVEEVKVGTLAVTVRYVDGMEIQLLPAAKYQSGLVIPNSTGTDWQPIRPKEFARDLTAANARLSNNLVPTIKLAKAIIATMPESYRLSGYHVETLALRAFNGYEGERSHAKLLRHLFESASELVTRPIRDVTGQSDYVDADLGDSGSDRRKAIAATLMRVARRMENARSVEDWREILPQFDSPTAE